MMKRFSMSRVHRQRRSHNLAPVLGINTVFLVSDRIPSLADVCSAIAEGDVAVAIEGSMYQVKALELRRYFTKLRSVPAIAKLLDSLQYSDSLEWCTTLTTPF